MTSEYPTVFSAHVLQNVLLHVSDACDLLSLSAVCVRWHVQKREEHWERLCRARWPVMDWEAARRKRPTLDWYVRYRMLADRELWYLRVIAKPLPCSSHDECYERFRQISNFVGFGFASGYVNFGLRGFWVLVLVDHGLTPWRGVRIGFFGMPASACCWRPWVQCSSKEASRSITDRECAMFMACGKQCSMEASSAWANATTTTTRQNAANENSVGE